MLWHFSGLREGPADRERLSQGHRAFHATPSMSFPPARSLLDIPKSRPMAWVARSRVLMGIAFAEAVKALCRLQAVRGAKSGSCGQRQSKGDTRGSKRFDWGGAMPRSGCGAFLTFEEMLRTVLGLACRHFLFGNPQAGLRFAQLECSDTKPLLCQTEHLFSCFTRVQSFVACTFGCIGDEAELIEGKAETQIGHPMRVRCFS